MSKCPIVLTTEQPLPFFKALHAKHVKFSRPGADSDEAVQALRTAAVAATSLARSPSLTELPDRQGASFFQGKPAPTRQVSPEASESAISTSLTLPQLSPGDASMLRVLCVLCDGDIRAALATLQCLPDRFMQQPCSAVANLPAASVDAIDLTESPITSPKTPRTKSVAIVPSASLQSVAETESFPFITFEQFLAGTVLVDFALFDRLLHSFARIKSKGIVNTHCVPLAPVVCEVSPRSGLCSGGFLVTISGAHFLQRARYQQPQEQHIECVAPVRVLLGGVVECPCQVKSDDTIVAYIPAVESEGVYSLTVELQFDIGNTTQRSFSVRSDICGEASGWIKLSRRSFPALRMSLSGNLRMPTLPSANSLEEGASSSSSTPTAEGGLDSDADTNIEDSDDGKENTHAGNGQADCIPVGKKVLGKRLRRGNQSQATEFTEPKDEAVASDAHSSSLVAGSKRRRGRVVVADEEESDEHSAAPTELASSCEGDNQSLVRAPQLVDEQTVERVCAHLTAAMQCALQAMQENSLSDAFLEPVSELDVPGYSSVVQSPMDLGTVADSLAEQLYTTEKILCVEGVTKSFTVPDIPAFVADVRQIWSNCIIFNGTTAPLVRSAYLLSFLFERTLRDSVSELQSTELETGVSGALRLHLTGPELQEVFACPACDVFDRCVKLRKGLTEARMLSLLEDRRRFVEPTEVILSQEEALLPEFVEPADLLAALHKIQSLRDQRQAALCSEEGVNSKPLVPGLRVLSTQYQARPGQECETCDPITESAVHVLPLCINADSECLEALLSFAHRADLFCDADVFTSTSRRLGSYGCCEHEDTPADSSFVDFIPVGPCALPTATSFAEDSEVAKYCGIYGQLLRASAVCGVDSVAPVHCSSSRGSTLTQATMRALGSRHLEAELSRVGISRTAFAVVNGYTCSPGNRTSSVLAGHCMTSQCFVPRSLALDALPLLSVMARCEQESDRDVLESIRAGEASGLHVSEYSLSSRRSSTRRSAAGGVRSHQCFQYLTSALGASEELIRQIITCINLP